MFSTTQHIDRIAHGRLWLLKVAEGLSQVVTVTNQSRLRHVMRQTAGTDCGVDVWTDVWRRRRRQLRGNVARSPHCSETITVGNILHSFSSSTVLPTKPITGLSLYHVASPILLPVRVSVCLSPSYCNVLFIFYGAQNWREGQVRDTSSTRNHMCRKRFTFFIRTAS